MMHACTSVRCLILSLFPTHVKVYFTHTPLHLFTYCSFPNTGHSNIVSPLLLNCWNSLNLLPMSVFNIFVDILFVMPRFVPLLFHFQFLISDVPSTATGMCLLHYKLCISTSNILAIHYVAFPFFSLRSLLILLMCALHLPSLCHGLHLIGLKILQPFLLF